MPDGIGYTPEELMMLGQQPGLDAAAIPLPPADAAASGAPLAPAPMVDNAMGAAPLDPALIELILSILGGQQQGADSLGMNPIAGALLQAPAVQAGRDGVGIGAAASTTMPPLEDVAP